MEYYPATLHFTHPAPIATASPAAYQSGGKQRNPQRAAQKVAAITASAASIKAPTSAIKIQVPKDRFNLTCHHHFPDGGLALIGATFLKAFSKSFGSSDAST
jgi:hypothetical protein